MGLRDGILRALPAESVKRYRRFIEEYSAIRRSEGRGSEDPAYYLALPYKDLTGKNSGQWFIRGKSYRHFEQKILPALEKGKPLDVLDLGAGNGWMSYRLALRNHRPVAVDVLTDAFDGLGAARHYHEQLGCVFPLVEAEFDRLPFADAQFDLAVFNSSLHYSTNYQRTLMEARRCLRPSGRIVILDSPVYQRRDHGERMRQERHQEFEARFGFRSDSIPSIEFLHEALLDELADFLHVKWEVHKPWYGWNWHLRPWKARLSGRRPPSRFWILVGVCGAP